MSGSHGTSGEDNFGNNPTDPKDLKKAHDRLCQEIGRNLLRFQLLELLLKDLVAKSKVEVTLDSVKQPQTGQQTLGGISTRFFEEVVSELDPVQTSDESNHLKCEFYFRIPLNEEAKTEWMDRVRKLIKERNDLIHTSLKTMSLDTPGSCQKEIEQLLVQRKRIQLEIDWLKSARNGRSKMMKEILTFL